jgi:energy-coupling factor transport system permease protein
VAALMTAAAHYAPTALDPPAFPLTAPTLPLWPALSVLAGLLPAVVAPVPVGRADARTARNARTTTTEGGGR